MITTLWLSPLILLTLSLIGIATNCDHTYHVMSDQLHHYQVIDQEWVCGPSYNYTMSRVTQRIDIDTNETRWQDCMITSYPISAQYAIIRCGIEPEPSNISRLD